MVQVRDEFPKPVIEALSRRAAFICSNPDCRALTIAPSDADETKWLYIGKSAHICAAAQGGPRYQAAMTPEERRAASNGIFLCANCADMIDKNDGLDFPEGVLRRWKNDHEKWVAANLNKRRTAPSQVTTFHVTSVAQQGGITAGIVNLAPRRRQMNDEIGTQLMHHLPDKSRTIRIIGLLGNAESMSFATQIRDYLKAVGYKVDGPSEGVFGRYIPPLEVFPKDYAINVGASEQ